MMPAMTSQWDFEYCLYIHVYARRARSKANISLSEENIVTKFLRVFMLLQDLDDQDFSRWQVKGQVRGVTKVT